MMSTDGRASKPTGPSLPGLERPTETKAPPKKKTDITYVVPAEQWGKRPDAAQRAAAPTALLPKPKPKR